MVFQEFRQFTVSEDTPDICKDVIVKGVAAASWPRPRRPRHVRFDETATTSHDCSLSIQFVDDDDGGGNDKVVPPHDELWYTAQDYRRFRKETEEMMIAQEHELLQSDNDGTATTTAWVRLYFGLRQAHTAEQVQAALDVAPNHVDDTAVGMLLHPAVPAIAADFHMRRRHLLQQVQRLQTTVMPLQQRHVLLRETSLLTSRAACLYATVVAKAAVGADF